MEYIDKMPALEIDGEKKEVFIKTDEAPIKLGLIHSLVMDTDQIIIEKYRVYVPNFAFAHPWENIIGSNAPAEDEATEDYDRQSSNVFLDKKTRKPILYKFVIDREGNLFIAGKRLATV